MIDRIGKNEERLDNVLSSVKNLEESLEGFKLAKKDLLLLNKYYGSSNWFKDKDSYEKGLIKVKAGVLSEDAVWNLNEEIGELILEMKSIVESYRN